MENRWKSLVDSLVTFLAYLEATNSIIVKKQQMLDLIMFLISPYLSYFPTMGQWLFADVLSNWGVGGSCE